MFPGQAPGVALLLLRVSVAVGLFVDGSLRFPLDPGRWDFPLRLALGVFLLAGAFTPLFALLACAVSIVDIVDPGLSCAPIALIGILNASALGLLGPGAFSLDARIFGRRLIVLPDDDSDLS
ncbi:hypothetical protein [Dokdonella sp.]|uniref:hypothetical protein n=1 Tax=Dokdonella sp. TaxID=2291710 RepID=UPI002F41F58C